MGLLPLLRLFNFGDEDRWPDGLELGRDGLELGRDGLEHGRDGLELGLDGLGDEARF